MYRAFLLLAAATAAAASMLPPSEFNATAKLKRSDFGISYAVPVVSDEVSLTISGEFIRQP